jgi:hypothetical protein
MVGLVTIAVAINEERTVPISGNDDSVRSAVYLTVVSTGPPAIAYVEVRKRAATKKRAETAVR